MSMEPSDVTLPTGLYGFDGEFEVQIALKETGVEEMIKKCGWMIACQYISFDPAKIRIVFVELPQVPSTSVDFLIAVLRSALVCIGLPVAANGIDVFTKIKLWNVHVFKGKLPRVFPMQELFDVWDQSCTIVGDYFEMRIVSHAGRVNPDMALKHYTRCGQDNQTVANLIFVGA